MSSIYRWEGKILRVEGKLAIDERCCCGPGVCDCDALPDTLQARLSAMCGCIDGVFTVTINEIACSAVHPNAQEAGCERAWTGTLDTGQGCTIEITVQCFGPTRNEFRIDYTCNAWGDSTNNYTPLICSGTTPPADLFGLPGCGCNPAVDGVTIEIIIPSGGGSAGAMSAPPKSGSSTDCPKCGSPTTRQRSAGGVEYHCQQCGHIQSKSQRPLGTRR